MTTIISNGSKWAGQMPDSIENLIEVLNAQSLDRSFEAYGNFVYPLEGEPGTFRFFGNFLTVSHVFNIDSNDPTTISKLRKAIEANKRRPDYLAQQKPKHRCHRPGARVNSVHA